MPDMKLVLRRATPDDSEFAYAVKKAAFREYVEQVWGWDEDEQRRLHELRFAQQEYRIINHAGTDVGYIALGRLPDQVYLNQIFILPEHQGQGIGAECMRRIIEEARQLGLPVRLRVLKVNPRAQVLYERLGFRAVGEDDVHVLMERTVWQCPLPAPLSRPGAQEP